MLRGDGPFKIIERVGYNSYKLLLPREMVFSATFDIGDLSPYVGDCFEDPLDLRANPLEEWEVDIAKDIIEGSLNLKEDHGANYAKEEQEE